LGNNAVRRAVGGADGNRKQVLDRPYGRLDRQKTKAHLMERCRKSGVRLEAGQVEGLEHSPGESAVAVAGRDPLRARMIVDCTGHARGFVEFEDGKEPGYQAAYGIEAKITPGTYPLPLDEMLLMDYRDEHMATPEARAESERVPTFIYCMPTDDGNVFFEETSLIANPPVPFEDLKRRLYERLALWGTEVLEVEEEEFCLIPMGGAMPRVPQRVVGFGGSAGLVHPATGYMVSRTWELAAKTADAIVSALRTNGDDAEGAAAEVWRTMWSERYMRNRDFSAFGGEYLESIGLQELREFFGAFFVLPFQQWGGFLSHRLQEPFERLTFGLGVWSNTSNRVRFSLALKGFLSGPDGWYMLARSVLPLDDGDDKTFPSKESRPDFFKKTL
jgi:lycopene beta-cyclase